MVSEEEFQSFSQVISLWYLYMKFHHIWLTDISDILLSKCERMMSDAMPY